MQTIGLQHPLGAGRLRGLRPLLAFLIFQAVTHFVFAQPAARELYFFVIDRSGSMGPQMNNLEGPVKEVFQKQINKLPENADVRIVFFSTDRTRTYKWSGLSIRNQRDIFDRFEREFKVEGETRLYLTLAEILDEISADQKNYTRFSLLIFTDGEDSEKDVKKRAEMRANVGKKANGLIVTQPLSFLQVFALGANPPPPLPEPIVTVFAKDRDELNKATEKSAPEAPEAKIKIVPESPVEVGAKINFIALPGKGQINLATWTFADGTVVNGIDVEYVFKTAGDQLVQLKVSGPGGQDPTSRSVKVIAREPLVAKFSHFPQRPKVGDMVTLIDESTGRPESRQWLVPGKKVEGEKRAEFQAAVAGAVTVRLVVKRGDEEKPAEHVIDIVPLLAKADFEILPSSSVRFGDKVTFRAASTEAGATYRWTIGGQQTSTDREWVWTAQRVGGVEVALAVTNKAGASEPRAKALSVAPNPPDPSFDFAPARETIKIGDKATATARATADNIKHSWTVADRVVSTTKTAEVVGTSVGPLTVVHAVSWAGGDDKLVRTLSVVADPPSAEFTMSPKADVVVGTKVNLAANKTAPDWKHSWTVSTGEPTQTPERFEGAKADFIAKTAGLYSIIHNVVSPGGNNSDKLPLNVISSLSADFTAIPSSGRTPLEVIFKPKASAEGVTYLWDFGDGAKNDIKEAKHTYRDAGSYRPRLTVDDKRGRSAKSDGMFVIEAKAPIPWAWIIGTVSIAALAVLGWGLSRRIGNAPLHGYLSWKQNAGWVSRPGELEGMRFELSELNIPAWASASSYALTKTKTGEFWLLKDGQKSQQFVDDQPVEVDGIQLKLRA